ncbi:MAG: hypothetical protein QXH02_01735 [Desulfurococcaceae archaeon]
MKLVKLAHEFRKAVTYSTRMIIGALVLTLRVRSPGRSATVYHADHQVNQE